MNNFCAETLLLNPKCKVLETFNFVSEEPIFDILLDIFKSELPKRMKEMKDCQAKPMYIAEDAIGLVPPKKDLHFELLLNPLDASPEYDEGRMYRKVPYTFELILTVHNQLAECTLWEMIKFKNAVEGLLIASEFAIDGYESVEVEPKGFNYYIPTEEGNVYRRQGSYKFTVTVSQYKI